MWRNPLGGTIGAVQSRHIAAAALVLCILAFAGSCRAAEPWDMALTVAAVLLAGVSLLWFFVARVQRLP